MESHCGKLAQELLAQVQGNDLGAARSLLGAYGALVDLLYANAAAVQPCGRSPGSTEDSRPGRDAARCADKCHWCLTSLFVEAVAWQGDRVDDVDDVVVY